MKNCKNHIRITLRCPEDLHQWLTKNSEDLDRSLNSEIVHHLMRAMKLETPENTDTNAFTDIRLYLKKIDSYLNLIESNSKQKE